MRGLSLTCQCEKTLDTCSNALYLSSYSHSPHWEYNYINFTIWEIFVSKKVKIEGFFAMLNNFHEFEELVFFDLLIPDSRFRILDSGFRFWLPDPVSGFRSQVSGFRFPVSGV